ncbi:MAG TPA: TatD family hydrolase [bacterium]|nr:TatD family hydrolase [bacterium]
MVKIDSHAHLLTLITDKKIPAETLFGDMLYNGVTVCVNVILSPEEARGRATLDNTCRDTGISLFHIAGIHPHDASKWDSDDSWIRDIAPDIVAIGEVGMDLHYDFSPPDKQEKIFRRMVELAIELRKPLVIHGRKAESRIFDIINEYKGIEDRVLFHCYTGDAVTARRIFDRSWSVSLPGILTFPDAEEMREVLMMSPAGQLCFETDSPYLAPVPHRGKVNTPAHVADIYRFAAQLTGLPLPVWEERALQCFERVFGRGIG